MKETSGFQKVYEAYAILQKCQSVQTVHIYQKLCLVMTMKLVWEQSIR